MSGRGASAAATLPRLSASMFWISAAEFAAGAVALGTSVVSARVLGPSDFGLMASVGLVVAVLEALSYTGFEQALIQTEQSQNELRRLLDAAWTWQVLRGVLLGALFAASGSLLANFYREPRVAPLVWATSTVFVLRGFSNVGPVFYSRTLDFRRQFGIKLAQVLLGAAVYVPAVLWMRNVWALCISQVGGAALGLVVSYVAHPYRPRLSLDRGALQSLFGYGRWVSLAASLVFFGTQGDDLFVSRYLGLAALGVYQMAYAASNLPATHISHVISRASLPTYARVQGDLARVRSMFLRVVTGTFALSVCVAVGLALLVPSYVRFVVTEKWAEIIPLVRILVIAGLLRATVGAGGALFQALGRPELDFRMQVPRFLVLVAGIWPATAWWGVRGVAYVAVASIASCVPQWILGVREVIGVRPVVLLRQLLPGVIAALPLAVLLYGAGVLCEGASAAFTLASLLAALALWLGALWGLARAFGVDLIGMVRGLVRGEPAAEGAAERGAA